MAERKLPNWYRKRNGLIEVSGTGIEKIPNLLKSRVPISKNYRTSRSVGWQYRKNTKVTEVSCIGIKAAPNKYRYPRYLWSKIYRYPGYIWVGVPKLPNCRVPSLKKYRTYRLVGYGIEKVPKLTEVSGTGIEKILILTIYGDFDIEKNAELTDVGHRYRGRTEQTLLPPVFCPGFIGTRGILRWVY